MIQTETNVIYNEDCLQGMKRLADGSIDMILCDLPYGTTNCSWDTIIPFQPLWEHYERVIKDNGAIVLTGSQPFSTKLISSNIELFRYEWIWDKKNPTNFPLARKQPLKYHENILVFYKNQPTYNPQKWRGLPNHNQGSIKKDPTTEVFKPTRRTDDDLSGEKFPRSIIEISKHSSQLGLHPTQKPVELFEYLIKTYTNPGDVVLDNCMGSGTTAIACINTERRFVGFETEKKYFDLSLQRIKSNVTQLDLFG